MFKCFCIHDILYKRINIKVFRHCDWYFFILCQLCQIHFCLWNFFYFFLFFLLLVVFFSALMLCKPGFYFLFRNNVSSKMVSVESKTITPETVAAWNGTTLPTLLSNYGPEDIYNADKFGLFYQCLPDKSYQLKTDKCTGGKHSKSGWLVWQLSMPLAINSLCLLLAK